MNIWVLLYIFCVVVAYEFVASIFAAVWKAYWKTCDQFRDESAEVRKNWKHGGNEGSQHKENNASDKLIDTNSLLNKLAATLATYTPEQLRTLDLHMSEQHCSDDAHSSVQCSICGADNTNALGSYACAACGASRREQDFARGPCSDNTVKMFTCMKCFKLSSCSNGKMWCDECIESFNRVRGAE